MNDKLKKTIEELKKRKASIYSSSNEFEKFLDNNKLSQLKMTMSFDSKKELTANDFGW